jgi:FkbM family methyltransferase
MNPWKPWFIFRPSQILRRMTFSPTSTHRHMPVAWGGRVLARDDDHIGRCLGTTGIYDLAVSEILFRLIRPGDLVVDAGANIGYMSVLAATAGAQVISFEPNPELLPILRQNVGGRGDVRPVALGAQRHQGALIPPDPAANNSGLGRLGTRADEGTVPVHVETLDGELHGRSVSVLKMDVEGAEASLLEGAATALRERRLINIIFEDHHGAGSAVMTRLMAYGYTIYSIGWTLGGPTLGDPHTVSAHAKFEAPSYLATLTPDVARAACARRGWIALRPARV